MTTFQLTTSVTDERERTRNDGHKVLLVVDACDVANKRVNEVGPRGVADARRRVANVLDLRTRWQAQLQRNGANLGERAAEGVAGRDHSGTGVRSECSFDGRQHCARGPKPHVRGHVSDGIDEARRTRSAPVMSITEPTVRLNRARYPGESRRAQRIEDEVGVDKNGDASG